MRLQTKKPISFQRLDGGSPNLVRAFSLGKGWLVPAGILFFFTILLYWPSYGAGLIWDDELLLGNVLVRGGWPGLRDIWTTTKFPDFVPLTATTFWLEHQLGAGTPMMRHATNIVLQGFNVALVWMVLRHLKVPGAWLAAAVFAAHPLCVTSVTWIAERKNVLSMSFYLLSLLFYLRVNDSTEIQRAGGKARGFNLRGKTSVTYWLSFFFFIMALLSKSSVVVLPVVFLLCAWWRNNRISIADLQRALPFFVVAFAMGVATLIAHYHLGPKIGTNPMTADNLLVRTLAGSWAVWFYLGKGLWPAKLTMIYPRWEIDPASPFAYLPGLALVGAAILFWRFRQSWGRACLFGLGYFILALAPTLGVLKMAYLTFSQVADHFQFLALPGLIALLVGGACHVSRRALHGQYFVGGFFLLVPLLAALSWQHQQLVGNHEALWRDNIEKNPTAWIPHNNVAVTLLLRGQTEEAEVHYRKALELLPDYADHRQAAALNPTRAAIHFGIGNILLSRDQLMEAIDALSKAVEFAPTNTKYQNNLAATLLKLGRREESLPHFREMVRLEPADAGARANLALVLSQLGKTDEASEQYRIVLDADPAHVSAHNNLGTLLAAQGRNDEALRHFTEAVRLQPEHVQARAGMGAVLTEQGRNEEAAVHSAIAYFLIGRELADKNNPGEAKRSFLQALMLDAATTIEFAGQVSTPSVPNSLTHLDALAAICAEAGRFADAVNVLEKAGPLAEAIGQTAAAMKYQKLIDQYRERSDMEN